MCFDIGIVTCGPNEALVVSGMGYGEINEDTKEYRPYVVMGDILTIILNKWMHISNMFINIDIEDFSWQSRYFAEWKTQQEL